METHLTNTQCSQYFFCTLSAKINHINSLKNNSAPGVDKISHVLIRNLNTHILNPLLYIINLSFTNVLFLLIGKPLYFFKRAVDVSGCRHNIENYRPNSVINNFAKIFEKCFKRICHFFES